MLFRFRDFEIYKEAQLFRKSIYEITNSFPDSERHALTSQIRRAAISICLNIAEGSNRGSDVDFSRFLSISLGSLEETIASLDIAFQEGYISEKVLSEFLNKGEVLGAKIIGFKNKLKAQSAEHKA